MSCRFAQDEAAYVLGALSPADRHEFEEHLADCDTCSRAVTDLSGLPGLLARVDPPDLKPEPLSDPVPETLLPALQRRVRRHQRRRTWTAAGLAAAATAAVVTGTFTVVNLATDAPTSSTSALEAGSRGRHMTPVGAVPVRATVAFRPTAWGTRLDMVCTYQPPASDYGGARRASYVLLVHTRDGRTQQVATWRPVPGRTMRLTASTGASRSQIASVEVRTAHGRPVLRFGA